MFGLRKTKTSKNGISAVDRRMHGFSGRRIASIFPYSLRGIPGNSYSSAVTRKNIKSAVAYARRPTLLTACCVGRMVSIVSFVGIRRGLNDASYGRNAIVMKVLTEGALCLAPSDGPRTIESNGRNAQSRPLGT